jgi:hypothetical protein
MSKIVPVVTVGVLLLAGALAVGYAGGEAGQQYTVENESWKGTPGEWTQLNESNVPNATYESSVSVRDSNGTRMRPGQDYAWNTTNGTVKVVDDGRLDNNDGGLLSDDTGENATITYGYGVPTEQQQALVSLFATSYQFAAPLVMILMVGVGLGALLRFVS